jgi:hypothetical protein
VWACHSPLAFDTWEAPGRPPSFLHCSLEECRALLVPLRSGDNNALVLAQGWDVDDCIVGEVEVYDVEHDMLWGEEVHLATDDGERDTSIGNHDIVIETTDGGTKQSPEIGIHKASKASELMTLSMAPGTRRTWLRLVSWMVIDTTRGWLLTLSRVVEARGAQKLVCVAAKAWPRATRCGRQLTRAEVRGSPSGCVTPWDRALPLHFRKGVTQGALQGARSFKVVEAKKG